MTLLRRAVAPRYPLVADPSKVLSFLTGKASMAGQPPSQCSSRLSVLCRSAFERLTELLHEVYSTTLQLIKTSGFTISNNCVQLRWDPCAWRSTIQQRLATYAHLAYEPFSTASQHLSCKQTNPVNPCSPGRPASMARSSCWTSKLKITAVRLCTSIHETYRSSPPEPATGFLPYMIDEQIAHDGNRNPEIFSRRIMEDLLPGWRSSFFHARAKQSEILHEPHATGGVSWLFHGGHL